MNKTVRILAIFLLASLFGSRQVSAQEPLQWQWQNQERRWFVETDIVLPTYMWFHKDRNKSVRVVSYQLQFIMGCQVASERRKGWELHCEIEDIGMRASGASGDTGEVQEVLNEVDAKLTGASMEVYLTSDGFIRYLDFSEIEVTDISRTTSVMTETLRLSMARAVAGFDLQLPEGKPDGVWAQYESTLMSFPASAGSQASNQIVHRIIEERAEGITIIETAGKGLIGAANISGNLFDAQLYSFSVFNTKKGYLKERIWSVFSEATAGSVFNEGYKSAPYIQWGRLFELPPAEQVNIFDTVETALPGTNVSELPLWRPLSQASADLISGADQASE